MGPRHIWIYACIVYVYMHVNVMAMQANKEPPCYVTEPCNQGSIYVSNIRSLCTNHRMATSQRDEGVSWSINNEPGGLRSNLQGNTSSLWIVMIFQLACKHAHTWATSAYIEHKLSLIPFFKLILYYKFIYLCASICWFMVIHSCD